MSFLLTHPALAQLFERLRPDYRIMAPAPEYRGGQRVMRGELQQLAALARQVKSPSLIIIGSVVTLADKLHRYGEANTLTLVLSGRPVQGDG